MIARVRQWLARWAHRAEIRRLREEAALVERAAYQRPALDRDGMRLRWAAYGLREQVLRREDGR